MSTNRFDSKFAVSLNDLVITPPKAGKSVLVKYSEDQPRDDHGRFGSGDSGDNKPSGGRVEGKDLTNEIKTKDLPAQAEDEDNRDKQLEYVAAKQGFDAPAPTITKDEFAKLQNPIVLYRGLQPYTNDEGKLIAGKDIEKEYISGKYFAGLGGAGNGTYWTTNKEYAQNYADSYGTKEGQGGHLIQAVLDPSAKIGDELTHSKAFDDSMRTKAAVSTTLAIRGFDGVKGYKTANQGDVFITFNRTAVKVVTND